MLCFLKYYVMLLAGKDGVQWCCILVILPRVLPIIILPCHAKKFLCKYLQLLQGKLYFGSERNQYLLVTKEKIKLQIPEAAACTTSFLESLGWRTSLEV